MVRPSRSRTALTAAVSIGIGAVGLILAPSALAASLTAPTAPSSVVAGTPFTVSGTGCTLAAGQPAGYDPAAYVNLDTDQSSQDERVVSPDSGGAWSLQVTFPAGTTGSHAIKAGCDNDYYNGATAYPDVTVTVTSGNSAPTTTEWKPGATPNTPGIASVSTPTTTGSTAPAGTTVVKVIKGFKPFETVTLVLHSTPVTLGTFTADAQGVLTASFTLPAGTPEGAHTLAFDGSLGSHFEDPIAVSTNAGTLAYTVAAIALPLTLGLVLVVAGAGTILFVQRRKAGAARA
jgi:hypothetical protein